MATRKNLVVDRTGLGHKVRYALAHPQRVPGHLRRAGRDRWLAFKHRDHVSYYRAVMASDTRRDPRAAVGSPTYGQWLALGRLQFDYLREHGLTPGSRVLDIGCGNLRAGWHLISYLEPGHYYGIDISPDILIAAKRTLTEHGLQAKLPHLTLTQDLTLDFLPEHHFDVVHAHSVFSHSPLTVIDECLAHVGRVLAPGGFFDFTFDRTTATEHQVLREDFYYRTETLVSLAARHGLHARFMDDWELRGHAQSKIRVTAAAPAPAHDAAAHR
ncbi:MULTISPECIES: class I SAM-dependent methyltransferase [Streptomyces]|uniref:Methyltransferase n=1 Tax=Streptomyces cacaoi TaxID=1898 RepID=A0A4Y3QYP5_STRCI|nr:MULTISPECIES: class I SAM-dependent methyltransferase [Streptomyces]NNG86408.1 class I SAM-dependent methyltransferase [Streptomyces cacaoi]QHF96996.1 class I SAM-dependent methyltransferase [Streptomyces sp. NHF165]GEB50566.1 methyltransferase [Streptomyces cacaoi]